MQRLTRFIGPAYAAWGEVSFAPDQDNVIEVPDEAVEALAPLGFIPAPPKPRLPVVQNIFQIEEVQENSATASKKRKR